MNKNKNIKKFPYSTLAEQAVLGSLMIKNKKIKSIKKILKKNDFFHFKNQIIFEEIITLQKNNKPIDLITLSESLKKKKILKKIGNFTYLAQISQNIPSILNILEYAKIVKEKSIIRKIINTAKKIKKFGYHSYKKNSKEILNYAETKILKLIKKKKENNKGLINIKKVLKSTILKIKKLIKKPYKEIIGLDTGYKDLNEKTYGLQQSELILIASRPSMGKTTFAMNICENVSIIYRKPVLIFSLEMPSNQIIMRMLSSLSRIDQNKIRSGNLNSDEWSRISSVFNTLLKKKNIYIDDSSQITPNDIRDRSKKIFKKYNGLSLIMIDYLQLMNISKFSENRNLEITKISQNLKSLAKELKVPVVALSQLNRSLEQRSDKRPINSDLRESGSLEQDADLILFIYRDEVYNNQTEHKGIAEIIIGKQRNGPIGTIKLTFNGKFSRFDNYVSKFHM